MGRKRSSESIGVVYGLVDPRNDQIVYVGQSMNFASRFYDHCKSKKINWKLARLRRDLRIAGTTFRSIILEESVPRLDLHELEMFWIAFFRSCGALLCNMNEGGNGGGRIISESTKEKLSLALRGRKGPAKSLETRRLISLAHKGKPKPIKTDEHRQKLIAALERGRHTPRKYNQTTVENRRMLILEVGKRKSTKEAVVKANSKNWVVVTPLGIEMEVYNLQQFCKQNGLDVATMVNVASGQKGRSHHKGYKVRRVDGEFTVPMRPGRRPGKPPAMVAGQVVPPIDWTEGNCDRCGSWISRQGKKRNHIFCSSSCWSEFFSKMGGDAGAKARWGFVREPSNVQPERIAA